jgi:light-independent protochlorophyllide reductase subunit B
VLYPEIARRRRNGCKRTFGQPITKTCRSASARHATSSPRSRARRRSIRRRCSRAKSRGCPGTRARSIRLSDRQARLRVRRRDPRHRRRAHRAEELGFTVVGPRHLQPRIRPRGARGRQTLRRRALITDDYLEVEAAGRRAAAGAGARHADGAPHRQALRHSLRGDLRAGACAGFPGALFAADGFRRRQRHLRHWVHPLMMGLEEHLLAMFRDDFEFNDAAPASHLGSSKRCARGESTAMPWCVRCRRARSCV